MNRNLSGTLLATTILLAGAGGTVCTASATPTLSTAPATVRTISAPAAAGVVTPGPVTARVVTTFAAGAGGSFAESMTGDGHGNLLVSLTRFGVERADGTWTDNVAQLYRVTPAGSTSRFGPELNLGACAQLMGVDVDQGRVFAVVGSFDTSCGPGAPASGVLRVTAHAARRVLTLPAAVFANGIAVRDDRLYVTDSHSGAVWSGPADRSTTPTGPWFTSGALTPNATISIGADGITDRGRTLYVSGYARGTVLAVDISPSGRPARARLIARDARLVRADGLAFDPAGRLWVAVNPVVDMSTMAQTGTGSIVVIDRHGLVTMLRTPGGALDYPTQVVPQGRTLYVANGAFVHGTPSVVALRR